MKLSESEILFASETLSRWVQDSRGDLQHNHSAIAGRWKPHRLRRWIALVFFWLTLLAAAAQNGNDGTNGNNGTTAVITNQAPLNAFSSNTALPDVGSSLVRVAGALILVIAIFLGFVWLFRNWQRLIVQRGHAPKLNILEVRSLGGRHSIYVVGYEQDRFLIASSPGGINLLTHLPQATAGDAKDEAPKGEGAAPGMSFGQALTKVLKGK